MNVLYTCDDNFIWIAGISMYSLFEKNKSMQKIHVYLLGDNISDENKQLLNGIADKYHQHFDAIDIPKLAIPSAFISQRWPRSAFTRLYSAQILPPIVEKVLYLDCDTLITDDISELENFDMSDCFVAGVKDCVSKYYKRNIGVDAEASYINAGVLLLNIKKMRDINIGHEIEKFLEQYSKKMFYADQDVLNGIFKGKFGILNPRYDVMTLLFAHTYKELQHLRKPANYYFEEEYENAVEHPAIVHFTTCMLNIRPWFEGSEHPYAEDFEKYWNMSPWGPAKKKRMVLKSNEAKALKILFCLPRPLAIFLLGFLHTQVRPLINRFK